MRPWLHECKVVLCNPIFIHSRKNRCFSLSSIYFLYPLASLPKMVKQEIPASIKQSKIFVLVTCIGPPLSSEINKRGMLAKLCMMLMGSRGAVHSEASLILETFEDPRTTNTRQR